MTSLTFYGGVNEIGGNKILLESAKAKIWLDFGLNFGQMQRFYDDFMQPRGVNGIGDFIEMGLVPPIKGLYRPDYVKRSKMLPEIKPLFDGVLLSHPHADHFGNFELLHPEIPFYMGETAKLIIQAIEETGSGFEYLTYRESFTGLHHTKNPKIDRKVLTHRTGDSFKINDLNIIPHHVDHSIPGAYGYIIETPAGAVVYTGDIRMHGAKGFMTKDFIKEAASHDPVALIVEGTRVGDEVETKPERKMGFTEEQVLRKIDGFVKETKGLVVANFPARDIDRFNTFYKAAVDNDRKLIIDLKQAYLLKMLENDKHLDVPRFYDKNILIYIKRCKNGFITESVPFTEKEKDYYLWQREFLNLKNSVTFKDIDQKKAIFSCNSFEFSELVDIQPMEGSAYIYSLCEPFNIGMELDHERTMNWINHFKLKYHSAHASGHGNSNEIKEVVETVNAKKVFPVHTERAEMFWKFSKNAVMTELGKKYNI